ncbi:hypothetical protein [Polyangium aurulentum]|uniref:hypothetical protein n=1 Tax=Polyangium aurulentum TaxID=2567896 RepID=UPI0010AE880B|nr:hypothetical protein [Polyangium aurulentum]UQA56419.1 hypothetical protein E8A73_034655 [Polyangium aurulentum]
MSQLVAAPERPLARTLREIVHNCDKDVPLASGDPRWQDLSAGRGDRATKMLVRDLEARQEGQFIHAAFVSHRGAGKSTEIRRVASQVEAAYHTVIIEATIEMDPLQIEAEDLLLNIALAVEAEMRRLGTPLSSDLLGRVEKWFAEVVRSTQWAQGYSAEIAAGAEGKIEVPFLGSLFAQAKALMKHESDYRTEVKQILKKYPGSLIQSVNDVLDAAQATLGGRALLVVVDNLDRYEPASMDELLVAGADRIRSLRCNLILTPPISLLLQPRSAQLDDRYACYDMFTVRLKDRKSERYDEFDGPGRDLLEQALARRIDLDLMIPEREVRDRLIAASGGGIRELLDLVSMAARFADGPAIGEADVEHAIARRKQRLRDQININGWWAVLRDIAETKQITDDPKCLAVLFHRLALKYNGEGWYDVHPLVAELKEFRP